MKSHVIAIFNNTAGLPATRHWSTLIRDKPAGAERIHPAIDRVFDRYHTPFWASNEYTPRQSSLWSKAELTAGLDRTFRLILQRQARIPQGLIEELQLLPQIESARPGWVALSRMPSGFSSSRTDYDTTRNAVYLSEAHHFTRGDRSVRIAVLDTGVDLSHPEFLHVDAPYDVVNILEDHDRFIGDITQTDSVPDDDVGHGTHVAGIAVGQGKHMPTGVAPECTLIPVRVLAAMERDGERFGAGLIDNINQGVKWAVDNGADVINMSLGVRHAGGGLPHAEIVKYAQESGVCVVAASGNDGKHSNYYPGSLRGVITVGALSRKGKVAAFSTYNSEVDLIAPGEDVYSCFPDSEYAFASGTSHAAPFVTGAVALMKSLARRLGQQEILQALKHTADRLDTRLVHPRSGFGKLNIVDALRYVQPKFP